MTVIAAVADGTTVHMAADTGEPMGGTWHGTARKIRRIELPHGAGTILLACTGAAGLMATAQRAIESKPAADLADLIPDGDLDEWADSLAIHLTAAAAAATPPLTEPDSDGMTNPAGRYLLGYRGRLWHLATHHALPVPDGITAAGAGADLALGYILGARDLARLTTGPNDIYGRDLVARAVTATCTRLPYCTAPDGPHVETLTHPS